VSTFPDEKLSVSADRDAGAWNSSFAHVSGDDVIESLRAEQVLASDVILSITY